MVARLTHGLKPVGFRLAYGKNPLHLNNRGQVFVSLSGFLEILSKTELSSDKVDDFQEEIFGKVLPQLAFEGREVKNTRTICPSIPKVAEILILR